MPLALYALTAGAFGIGVTEFVIMGLLLEVGGDLGVSVATAGLPKALGAEPARRIVARLCGLEKL